MNTVYIRMNRWLIANERTRVLPTDQWYLNFANKIFPIIKESPLYKDCSLREQEEAATMLSIYFQDAIAQTGGWKIVSDAYYSLYKSHLPFYTLTDSYVPDEINLEDLMFVLWNLKSHISVFSFEYTLQDPHDKDLKALAHEIYEMMDADFEDAPISDEPSSFMWLMGPDLLDMTDTPLPEITPETKLSKDAERCLEYSGGNPLLYFATYKELSKFFVEVLKWEDTPSELLPDLSYDREFVIYANAKGMLVAHDVAAYFCEPHNPMYNAKRAATEGYELFVKPGDCPFDLLKYGMIKNILPDLQLPFPGGKEVLHDYWDFIARYYLCEYYEGV